MADTPLFDCLRRHRHKGLAPFHTPGHKNAGFFPQELWQLDLTELPDTDALFEADGAIRLLEERLACVFGAGRTLLSAGGCTLAIQAMLRLASQRGSTVLIGRNAHRSAVNTCALLGLEPVWLLPQSADSIFPGTVQAKDVEAAFAAHPDIAACYLTSPDYYGELCDIRSIAKICRRHGAWLLVDNAHGSHLAFLKEKLHPLSLGADMTACSLHKTLPVLTGGAVLNLRDASLGTAAKEAMALFGSTSPSYLTMASVDLCQAYLREQGAQAYQALEKRVASLKALADTQGLYQPPGQCDPLRFCINTACAGVSGSKQTEFFHHYGVEPEFCDGQNAVFISTPFNTQEDFDRLKKAVSALRRSTPPPKQPPYILPEKVCSPRRALLGKTESVPLAQAAGRIAADTVCPCPPGIPVIMPGERINPKILSLLEQGGRSDIRCTVQGINAR